MNAAMLCLNLCRGIFQSALGAVVVAPVVEGQHAVAQYIYLRCKYMVDAAVGVVCHLKAVECAGWRELYMCRLKGICEHSTLGEGLVGRAVLRNIEVAGKDYACALATHLLDARDDELCTLYASNFALVVHMGIEEPELLLGLLIFEISPAAHAAAYCIPTERHLLRGLREPEGTAVEQLETVAAVEYRAVLTLCLATTSWSRVADSNPNWDELSRSASCRQVASLCTHHCNTCVAPDVRAVLI